MLKLIGCLLTLWVLYAIGLDGVLGFVDKSSLALERQYDAYMAAHPRRVYKVDPVDPDPDLEPLPERKPVRRRRIKPLHEPQETLPAEDGYQTL